MTFKRMTPHCSHSYNHLVWTDVNSRGDSMQVRRLRHQCEVCGALFGEFAAYALATPGTPEVDKDMLRAWNAHEDAKWRELNAAWEEQQRKRDEQDAAWWANYNNYLQSAAWRELRPRIFRRAGGICEGCRQAEATQVHHLSYKNVTNEFLWELVAVCDDCHARVHGIDEESLRIDFDSLKSARGSDA
jgi:5-methylcytosine-specific restriction endonuclease McrA